MRAEAWLLRCVATRLAIRQQRVVTRHRGAAARQAAHYTVHTQGLRVGCVAIQTTTRLRGPTTRHAAARGGRGDTAERDLLHDQACAVTQPGHACDTTRQACDTARPGLRHGVVRA